MFWKSKPTKVRLKKVTTKFEVYLDSGETVFKTKESDPYFGRYFQGDGRHYEWSDLYKTTSFFKDDEGFTYPCSKINKVLRVEVKEEIIEKEYVVENH